MNRKELFEKLNSLNLDKNKFYVLSGASLLAQNIVDQAKDIDISCDKEIYDNLDWKPKIGALGKEIKSFDCFDISYNLYERKDDIIKIEGYNFASLENILYVKLLLNRNKDKKIIEKLKSIIKA